MVQVCKGSSSAHACKKGKHVLLTRPPPPPQLILLNFTLALHSFGWRKGTAMQCVPFSASSVQCQVELASYQAWAGLS